MVNFRDVTLKQKKTQDKKQDKREPLRIVITDAQGNQSGSGSIWADEDARRVWFMVEGAIQPGQALCRRISDPVIGLGARLGYANHGSGKMEVLEDDLFLTETGDPTSFSATSPRDLEPGGRKQLWVYSKVITPLATYPNQTGLSVNVLSGDYPYLGTRKTFNGASNLPLTQNPNAGQHYYAGLYLDASNVLTVIYGASVILATTPPEPAWPAGAFRLSAVRINNTQTSIDFDTDVLDRRMAWSDEQGGDTWPYDNVYTVSLTNPNADYPTLTAALAAVPQDAIILLDGGDFPGAVTIATNGVAIVGLDKRVTSISSSSTDTVTITGAGCSLFNLTIVNSASSGSHYALVVDNTNVYVQDCILQKLLGSTLGAGLFHLSGTDLKLENVEAASTGATSNYGYYNITNDVSVTIIGGSYRGATADIYSNRALSTLVTQLPPYLFNGIVTHSGTTSGEYTDIAGNLLFLPTTGESGGVWRRKVDGLRVKETDLPTAVTNASAGDKIKLFPGTYTLAASLALNKAIEIEGDGPGITIITNATSNSPAIDVTVDNVIFRNLTIRQTAAGSASGPLSTDNAGLILDNVALEKTSGAPTVGYALWMYGGSATLRNGTTLTCSSGTSQYGLYNTTATATITVYGGKISGGTFDLLGDQAASVLTMVDPILSNASKSFSGTLQGEAFDQYGRRLRVKPAGINAVRLTLTTATPVTSADVTGATTVYAAPYKGSEIEVYNSSFWIEAPFDEISITVPSTIYRLFDVFVYDNAGTLALEVLSWAQSTAAITGATNATPIVVTSNGHGMSNGDLVRITGVSGNTATNGVWTISAVAANTFTLTGSRGNGAYTSGGIWYRMNEARATGLSLQNGRYCKTGTLTRLYLGTATTGATSGQTSDAEVNGGRFVWNYFNRVLRRATRTSTSSHTNNAAAWQRWNNSDLAIDFVVGVVEDALIINVNSDTNQGAGTTVGIAGVGINTSNNGASCSASVVTIGLTNQINASAPAIPRLGYNFLYDGEFSAGGLTTFENWNSKLEVPM